MRRSTTVLRPLAAPVALWLAACLGGCMSGCMMSDPPPSIRAGDGCVIGGCSAEICAEEPQFSPCIWHDAYVCFRDAICTRQAGGACGWTPTPELTACLASHDPLPGSPLGSPLGLPPGSH